MRLAVGLCAAPPAVRRYAQVPRQRVGVDALQAHAVGRTPVQQVGHLGRRRVVRVEATRGVARATLVLQMRSALAERAWVQEQQRDSPAVVRGSRTCLAHTLGTS